MAQSVTKLDLENVESQDSTKINSSIKKLVTLKELVEKSDKKVECLANQTSKLLESNRNIEVNYNKIMSKISDIDAQISENTKIHNKKMQELEDSRNERISASHKQCNDSLSEIGKYADNFSQWITEYSRDILMKNIENYHTECKKVSNELANLKQEINDMEEKCNTNYIEANIDVDDLQNIGVVLCDIKQDKNNLIRDIRSMQDILNKIKDKIKQNKTVINEYKTKQNIS